MNCPQPQQLQQLLDDTLPADQQPPIQAHLDTCAACQKTLEQLAAGAVTWDKTAQNLGEKPPRDETALIAAVEKLHDTPTSAIQTQAENVSQPVDEDLSFLQPSTKPNSLGRLDEYEILAVIGKGGFGIVLKAFDESLHRIVAIKVMLPHLASNGTARDRFIREAKAAAAVVHENVVTIHVVEKKAKIPYLVMQFVSGVTLNEKIDKGGPLGLKEILRIGMQIAEGLAAAAKLGLVHRDIKPANILLENGVERVKITDFGLARTTDDASVSQSGTVAGTPMYMSPEQANGEQVDHRSDLFSLGSVLYVMCTGRPPFRATSTMAVMRRVCDETATPVRQINSEIPDWLGDIIAKLHAKKPGERFQTAKEVADLLGQQLARIQQPSGTTPAVETATIPAAALPVARSGAARSTFRQMRPWLGAGGLVMGMLVIFLVVYSLWKPAGQTAFQMDANEVLKHLVGAWSVEFATSGPNPKTVRGVIRYEWVANEKFLRAYSNTDDGRESLIMYRYDPDAKTFRRWAFGAVPGPGVYEGPGTGEWDMKASTLAWRAELPLSHKVIHEDRWLDGDNFEWKTEVRNHVGAVVLKQTKKMHRLTTNDAVGPKLPPDSMRARELAVLERMLGKWTTNNDVTLVEMKDLKVKSQSVQETTPILANVFFETRERTQPGDREDYLITGYDDNRKIYRFWHFGADGAVTEADGTWNKEDNKLTWKSIDGRLTGVWNLANPNEHRTALAAKDAQGRRLYEVDGVARRAGAADSGSVVKPPALGNEGGVLDYAEIHDADEKRFDAWIAQMKKDGYRPVSLSVQTVKESPRYTSVAIKEEAAKVWEFARVRSDDAKHIEDMRNKDYVAIAQCVYREKSYLHQAYVWVLDKNASMDWPSLGSKEDIDKKIAEAHKRKARLVYRSAFQGAAIVYDIIVGGPTNVSWADSVDQSLEVCKTWIEKQKLQGWRPEHLYTYGAGRNTQFGAILVQNPKGPDWDVSWALTPGQYEAELAERKRRGFRPHTAVGHDDDAGALHFSVIWIRYFDLAAKTAPMPP
jgi:hypothetical protein